MAGSEALRMLQDRVVDKFGGVGAFFASSKVRASGCKTLASTTTAESDQGKLLARHSNSNTQDDAPK